MAFVNTSQIVRSKSQVAAARSRLQAAASPAFGRSVSARPCRRGARAATIVSPTFVSMSARDESSGNVNNKYIADMDKAFLPISVDLVDLADVFISLRPLDDFFWEDARLGEESAEPSSIEGAFGAINPPSLM